MPQKRPLRSNIHVNTRNDKCDWLAIFSICLVTILLILKQPISVEGDGSQEEEDDLLFCCNKSAKCGLNKIDCRDVPQWICKDQMKVNTSISLLEFEFDYLDPEVELSWVSKGRVFIKTRHSTSFRPKCYSVSDMENTIPKVCSKQTAKKLYATLMQQSDTPETVCRQSSLLVNTLDSYRREDLKQPEKWASYLIVRYESSPPSINVTFHQADDIAETNDWKFFYKIELLRMRAPANHSPWEMFDEKKIGHIQERGLERTVLFNNVSSGVYYVRLQLAGVCDQYCPYMNSGEVNMTEVGEIKWEDTTITKEESGNTLAVEPVEVPVFQVALLVSGCSFVILCLLLFLMLKRGIPARCKGLYRSHRPSTLSVPQAIRPPSSPDERELQRRKAFVVFTPEGISPEGSTPHEEVVRHFVNLLISQLEIDVRTVDLCIGDIRRLKPRKWVHQQLEVCDIIVIVNSEGAMERVRSAYFNNVDEWHADLKNPKIVDNVFDIAMEGIMGRLQSGQIRDSPSRYAVVTFPHSHSVANLIPYLSTEINYRLMSDWHEFCMHIQDIGISSQDLLQSSYQMLSSVDGIKLQDAIDNAVAHYTWNHVCSGDSNDSFDRNVCQVPSADIMTSPNCLVNGGVTIEQLLPSNPLDSGFESGESRNQQVLDLRAVLCEDHGSDCRDGDVVNHAEVAGVTLPLLINREYLPNAKPSYDFIPPTMWSSSETLNTNLSGSQRQLHMLPVHYALKRINDLPLTNEQFC